MIAKHVKISFLPYILGKLPEKMSDFNGHILQLSLEWSVNGWLNGSFINHFEHDILL